MSCDPLLRFCLTIPSRDPFQKEEAQWGSRRVPRPVPLGVFRSLSPSGLVWIAHQGEVRGGCVGRRRRAGVDPPAPRRRRRTPVAPAADAKAPAADPKAKKG
eukprot:7497053-Pyramimonas_sp.AAC.1